MEETNPMEVAVIVAMAIVLTLVPILVLKGTVRRRWRAAAEQTGLPLMLRRWGHRLRRCPGSAR